MTKQHPYDSLSLPLIACAVLAVCCWLQSARQLHRTVEWSADQLSTVPRLHSTSEITQARAHLDDVLYVARLYDEPIACSGTAVSGRFLVAYLHVNPAFQQTCFGLHLIASATAAAYLAHAGPR